MPICHTVRDSAALQAILPDVYKGLGPLFCTIKVRAETLPLVMPPKDGATLKDRFRHALLGQTNT